MYRFRVYGLELACAQRLDGLRGLAVEAGPNPADVSIDFTTCDGRYAGDSDLPVFASLEDSDGEFLRVLRAPDQGFVFCFSNGARFAVSPGGERIAASRPARINTEDVTSYLLGPVLGFVVRLRGAMCLHASVVRVGGAAVAFIAPGGAGKSSLCAYLAKHGHPVLADDVLALRQHGKRFRALAGPSRIRLWPDAARHLYGADVELPRVLPSDPGWDKRYRDIESSGSDAPLAAIYSGDPGDSEVTSISALAGRDAFLRLAAHRYPVRLPVPGDERRGFDTLVALARHVPVRLIRARRGLDKMGALYEAVRADLRLLATQTDAPYARVSG
jgi:hypothetical protein